MGETLENHAARVLERLRPGIPADAALREYLAGNRTLGAVGRRSVSRAVFAYFRWLNWLGPGESAQKRVLRALDYQARFERDPASVKPEALAARAVPDWLAGEMELSAGFLRKLQEEPSLWIRAKAGKARDVARTAQCDLHVQLVAQRRRRAGVEHPGLEVLDALVGRLVDRPRRGPSRAPGAHLAGAADQLVAAQLVKRRVDARRREAG